MLPTPHRPRLRSGSSAPVSEPSTATAADWGAAAFAHARAHENTDLAVLTAPTLMCESAAGLAAATAAAVAHVADQSGSHTAVATVIGPMALEEGRAAMLAAAAIDAGADELALLTITTERQLAAALELADSAAVPVLVSLTPVPRHGSHTWEWWSDVDFSSAAAVGINCADGLPGLAEPVALLTELCGPITLQPSAGLPTAVMSPAAWGTGLADIARRFNVAAVGGCCAAGPAHIAAVEQALGGP